MPEKVHGRISKGILGGIPLGIPGWIAEKKSGEIPKEVTGGLSERVHERNF